MKPMTDAQRKTFIALWQVLGWASHGMIQNHGGFSVSARSLHEMGHVDVRNWAKDGIHEGFGYDEYRLLCAHKFDEWLVHCSTFGLAKNLIKQHMLADVPLQMVDWFLSGATPQEAMRKIYCNMVEH